MAALVFINPAHTGAAPPAFMTPAPTRPPISACELLDGMPAHHVIRFQAIAPIRAPKITRASMTSAATMPVPMVWATCTPKTKKAMKLKNAAHATAWRARSTRVDTMVAIEFAASCSPLRKSNRSETAIRPIRTGRLRSRSIAERDPSQVVGDERVYFIRDVFEAVNHLLEVFVKLGADQEIHRIPLSLPVGQEQRLA